MAELDIQFHTMVPEHTILSDEDKQSVLDQYKITIDNLPKILITDPAIKHRGTEEKPLMPGDVVKIVRKSPTAGTAIAYRVVVQR